MTYWAATRLLILKNCRLQWRHQGPLVVISIASLSTMVILFLLQSSFDRGDGVIKASQSNRYPEPFSLNRIPRCIPFAFPDCITLAYVTSGIPDVKRWVETIAREHLIPVTAETKGFVDAASLNIFLSDYPNRTQAAYIFEPFNFEKLTNRSISFTVQYNTTAQRVFPVGKSRFNSQVVVPSMIRAMNKILAPEISKVNISADIRASIYPHPLIPSGDNAFIQFGSFLLFSVYFLVLVAFLSKMTEEKERGVREAMRLAGMFQSQHLISWGVPMVSLMLVVTLVLVGLGNAFDLSFFTKTGFSVYFFTFFIFAIALVGWTFLVAAFVTKTSSVSNVAFLLFIMKTIVGTTSIIMYVSDAHGEPRISRRSLYWRDVFATLPSTMFVRCVVAIAVKSGLDYNLTLQDVATYPQSYSLRTCWLWMLGSGAIAFAFAVYFDNVLPAPHGSPLSPIYCFYPSYWKQILCFSKMAPLRDTGVPPSSPDKESSNMKSQPITAVEKNESTAFSEQESSGLSSPALTEVTPSKKVQEEPCQNDSPMHCGCDDIRKGESDSEPLVVKNVVRRFKNQRVVDNISFSVARNTAFACLGHNGAGKSTLFKIIATSIGASSGDAFVYGRSVQQYKREARRILGVCHQHDVLWDRLSAAEHIDLFAALKGIDHSNRKAEIRDRLMDVGLTDFLNRPAGTYSGGMRRRLSVAISLIGNPHILLLDEFTTGTDPPVRRDLWAAIERAKKDRVVFIITHCMAEAERLADKIGIMAKGKMVVLGTSVALRKKYGAGYRFFVKLSSTSAEELKAQLLLVCPAVQLLGVTGEKEVIAQYSLPAQSSNNDLLNIIQVLEEQKKASSILEFTLNSGSLGDVLKSFSSGQAPSTDPPSDKRFHQRSRSANSEIQEYLFCSTHRQDPSEL